MSIQIKIPTQQCSLTSPAMFRKWYVVQGLTQGLAQVRHVSCTIWLSTFLISSHSCSVYPRLLIGLKGLFLESTLTMIIKELREALTGKITFYI